MDFVVVGFGLGALAVLLGLGVRDLGPWMRRVRQGRVLTWPEIAQRVAWGRRCRAGGLVVALAGGAIWLATLVALAAGAGDRTGLAMVLATVSLAAGGVFAWAIAYARANHPAAWSSPDDLGIDEVAVGGSDDPTTAQPSNVLPTPQRRLWTVEESALGVPRPSQVPHALATVPADSPREPDTVVDASDPTVTDVPEITATPVPETAIVAPEAGEAEVPLMDAPEPVGDAADTGGLASVVERNGHAAEALPGDGDEHEDPVATVPMPRATG